MPSLTEVRDAAVALLKTTFPELARVEAFSGEVSLDAVSAKRLQVGVSIFVTAISADNSAPPDSLDLDVLGSFGAVVVSFNKRSAEAGELAALAMAEKTALAVHGQKFGLAGVSPAIVRAITAETDESMADNSLCVWSVFWQQAVHFTTGG